MDKEKIKFLNQHKVSVSVSWDGINTNRLRRYDVILNNCIPLFSINKLNITSVLTKYSYPYLDIYKPLYSFLYGYNMLHPDNPLCISLNDLIVFDNSMEYLLPDDNRMRSEINKCIKEYKYISYSDCGCEDISYWVDITNGNLNIMQDWKSIYNGSIFDKEKL